MAQEGRARGPLTAGFGGLIPRFLHVSEVSLSKVTPSRARMRQSPCTVKVERCYISTVHEARGRTTFAL